MNEKQLKFFRQFCTYEKLTGGPDPHMAAVVHMCKDLPEEQQVWRVALYAGVYNVPTAEAIWREFPENPKSDGKLLGFFKHHWEGLRFRRERKSVALDSTHGENLTVYCQGALRTLECLPILREANDFEVVWEHAKSLPHVGRYAATKLCECWHRLGLVKAECQDIRSKGGWSPRTTLNLIYPERHHNPYDNSASIVAESDEIAWNLKQLFPELTWFEFEVMLCEYKASYKTKRQFPGRSLDSELAYEKAIRPYWGIDGTDHMFARKELSPEWALGEVQGWDPNERLKNLGHVLSDFQYTWSDFLYDYNKTTDFSKPVTRE